MLIDRYFQYDFWTNKIKKNVVLFNSNKMVKSNKTARTITI